MNSSPAPPEPITAAKRRRSSIGKFNFDTISDGGLRTNVSTALNLREGERVVVGTAMISSRALVLVLSADILD